MSRPVIYLKSIRPNHWLKNLLILIAPFTSGDFINGKNFSDLLLVFLMFSFASSSNYVLNDWVDREFDALHSDKQQRPFASKELDVKSLCLILFTLFSILIFLAPKVPSGSLICIVIYFSISISYSLYFKKFAVLELFLVAVGFVVRAIAGAVTVNVKPSAWFLVVIGFGALFLVSNKRLSELKYQIAPKTRKLNSQYSRVFLTRMIFVSMSITLATYSIWAFTSPGGSYFKEGSIVAFAFSLFRFHWISHLENVERPEEILFSDRLIFSSNLVLLVMLTIAIYVI